MTEPLVLDTESRSRAAYRRLLPALEAMPDEQVQIVNLDVMRTITTALGVLPEVRAFEARLRALPEFDVRCFEELEERAFALFRAEVLHLATTEPEEPIEKLVELNLEARGQLLASLRSLTAHGVIQREVESYRAPQRGRLGLASHVGMLVVILREHWELAQGKTPLTLQRLEECDELQFQLMRALGLREQRANNVSRTTSIRMRAFTWLVRAYTEVRRAICYLRFHQGDADTIIPSLYEKRTRRRKRASDPIAHSPQSTFEAQSEAEAG